MHQNSTVQVDRGTVEFSLTRGGAFYEFMRRLHIIRLDDYDLLRLSLAMGAIGWLPLVLIALSGPFASATPQFSLWAVVSIHVRYLIAIPLLFIAERMLERCCRSALVRSNGAFVGSDRHALIRLAGAAERARDSTMAELVLLAAVSATHASIWYFTGRAALIHDFSSVRAPALGLAWYALVSLPLFNFLLLRTARHWLIWTTLLWRLSRLRLRLIPTHPDRAGGIGNLAEPTYGISIALASVSCVVAASWGSHAFFGRVDPSGFAIRLATLVLIGGLIALAPLIPFANSLVSARLDGSDPYSGFAARYARLFEQRWVLSREQNGLLGTPDISGLADLISSYKSLETLRIVPFGREQVLVVVSSIVIPMLPVPLLAARLSLGEILNQFVKVLVLGS